MPRDRSGSEVEFSAAAESRRAYLATPAAGRGRGVLVVHEAEGLAEFPREVCDRLAREGFVALAPDWLGASGRAEPAQAQRLAGSLDPTRSALDAAVAALLGRDACEGARVGALGFGWGGPLALDLATRSRRIGAVAVGWSAHPQLVADVAPLECACLALFAERDELAPPEAAKALEAALRAGGRRGAVRIVPGVAAGFLDAARPGAYAAVAAAAAWDLLLGFLRAELA